MNAAVSLLYNLGGPDRRAYITGHGNAPTTHGHHEQGWRPYQMIN
jgi:hypothetical protein